MPNNSYENLLFELQTYEDKDSNSYPQIANLLPSDDQIFELDLNARTVDLPQFLSVEYDHNAEVVYFKCPRYYEGTDLAGTTCVIQYINAAGKAGLYWVPYFDVSHYDIDPEDEEAITPMLLVPWSIGGLATQVSGLVTFNLRFYNMDTQGEFVFNLSTRPTKGEILHGLDLTDEQLETFKLDPQAIDEIYMALKMVQENATTYWVELD